MRRGFTVVELLVVVAVITLLIALFSAHAPHRPARLDDRFGLVPLGLVLVWGVTLCGRHFRTRRLDAVLGLAAIAVIVVLLLFPRWGMHIKVALLESEIDPYFWEALLTCVVSLPQALVLGLLFWAAFGRAPPPPPQAQPPKEMEDSPRLR